MASPRSSASSLISISVTGMPALAKLIAIPPPIVPPPIMPIERTSRGGVSLSRPSTFAASRSAKNTCRNAADCGSRIDSMKSSRSRFRPSANGVVIAVRTHSMMRGGAVLAARFFRNTRRRGVEDLVARQAPPVPHSFGVRARRHRAIRARTVGPPAPRSPLTTDSIDAAPFRLPSLPGSGRRSASAPGWRPHPPGSAVRCVPPAPGNSPSLTSGKPTLAESSATR